MLFKKIISLLVLINSIAAFSQPNKPTDITDITKATFFAPGISYEKRVGKFQALVGQAFLATAFAFSYSSSFGSNFYYSIDPALSLQYRYYYNKNKRVAKGKRTEKNSLNYVSAMTETSYSKNSISSSYLTEDDRRPLYSFGIAWGFQRNYPKHFSLDLNIGGGYIYASSTTPDYLGQPIKVNAGRFTTISGLTLGFWLNKKK